MSSSIAAETATPSAASAVRARCRLSDAKARVAIIGQRPKQRERRRAHESPRGEPAGNDAQHERERDGEEDDVARHDGEAQRRAVDRLVVVIDDPRRRTSRRRRRRGFRAPRWPRPRVRRCRRSCATSMPMRRSAATSRRRSSTFSSMMHSRKIALATMVIMPMARWKRETTAKVVDVSTATSAERWARKPNAVALMRETASPVAPSAAGPDGEAVDAVAVAEERLELVEMQPDAILSARDLGGVGTSLDDGGDDDRVARHPRLRRDDDAVADAECGVGGEASVYCDRAGVALLRRRARSRRGEQQKEGERAISRRRGMNGRSADAVPRATISRASARWPSASCRERVARLLEGVRRLGVRRDAALQHPESHRQLDDTR